MAGLFFGGHDASAGTVYTTMVSATASSSANPNTFGPAVTLTVESGTQYGVGTQVTAVTGSGGGPSLSGKVWVTQNLGSSRDVTFQWRNRTLNETFAEEGGTPTSPPLNLAAGDFGLSGDIVDITGFAPGEIFVVFAAFSVPTGTGPGSPPVYDLNSNTADGSIHIASLNPVTGYWENTVAQNTSNSAQAVTNFQGSWEAAGSPFTVGSWGTDNVNMVSWAVVNHNSQFVVAPEPPSIAMLAVGAACFGIVRCRRSRQPSRIGRSMALPRPFSDR